MAPDRSDKIILYEKALELATDESFIHNIQLLKDEFKKTVDKEIQLLYKKLDVCIDKHDWIELRKIAKTMQGYTNSEADGHFLEGNALSHSMNYSEAISCYKKAVEIMPDMHEAWYNMGISYYNLGDYHKSISCYEKAVEIKPDKHEAWYNMGNSHYNLGDYHKSISCYEKAVEIKPDMHEAWYNLGISYFNLGDYHKSIACYEKAVEIKPDKNEAWYSMGSSYVKLQSLDKAYSSYSRFIALTVSPRPWNYIGIIELKKHEKTLFNVAKELQKLLNVTGQISERLEALCRLIILGEWNTVIDSMDLILKENVWPEEEGRKLEFFLQAEMLDILQTVPDQAKLKTVLKYWILVLQNRYPARKIKEKCLEFIYNYVKIAGKEKFSVGIVEEIVRRLAEEGIEASDVIIKILKAVKSPDTREAQKWMADPLFSEIVKMLSESSSAEKIEK
jgi:tetratricopeptide (TPR) repeat protein